MPETPDTTPDTTTHEAPGRQPGRNGYLAVLPEGWAYEVHAVGPNGERATVTQTADGHRVQFATASGDYREQAAETLADACRVLASGVKVLDRVAKGEETVRRAREEALSVLGPGARGPAPESPVTGSTAPSDD